ncbi:MAG: restriction endonuclease subunit S [Fusobacterium periodonticum]|nr:restriction endonuclease subunit S [Fusobacterium periodonticum]
MNILEEIQNYPVEWKELGEVALLKRGKTITSKTATDGPYPVISGGQKPAYFHGEFNREGETITVAGSGAYAGFVMYWDEPIFVSDAFSIESFEDALIPKFLYHYLLEKQEILFSMKKGSGVPHVYPKDVSKILIPIPPIEIQEKIVQKLDKMTEYVRELTSELTSRKKQYSFYRDKLLSFEDEVYQVEWKVLKDVATLKNGKDWKALSSGEIPVYGSGGEMGEFVSDYSYDKPTVLIPRKGSISNLFYLEKAFWNVDTIYYTEIDEKLVIPKYFYYYLTTVKLEEMATNPTRPSLTQAILDKIRIPVPSLEIQSRIIQVLDNFDTVCNDLNIGLPKEIELRQKQYEYFREKLLTFVTEGEYTESRVE